MSTYTGVTNFKNSPFLAHPIYKFNDKYTAAVVIKVCYLIFSCHSCFYDTFDYILPVLVF